MQLKIESLAEHVMRRYQVDLREFTPDRYAFTKTLRAQLKQRGKSEGETITDDAADFNEAELREVIDQLTRQLDAMGPVNLDAVHEYDELEERHTFLETQNADLTNSRRELLDVIARINQTTEKLFAETFAQVRINFREMFAELFGGGRADSYCSTRMMRSIAHFTANGGAAANPSIAGTSVAASSSALSDGRARFRRDGSRSS